MLYNKILAQSIDLNKKIQSLEKEIDTLPIGNIFCVKDKERIKWFHNDGNKTKYISKKQRSLAEQLAYKKYLLLLLKDYYQEKKSLDSYLKNHKTTIGTAAQELLSQPAYQELLSPSFKPLSQELSDWMHAPYQKSTQHPEHLTYNSISGNIVRSKSESIIDMLLYINKIPYRYECALNFRNFIIYPDFTIRHPENGKIYYWEHFGLMDNPSYSKNTLSKLELYISNHIIPGENLITTFETKHIPLTAEKVNDIINFYFL